MATNVRSDGYLYNPSILRKEYELLLADRAALPQHPALSAGYLGMGVEGAQIKRTIADLGSTKAQPMSETGAIVATAITLSEVSATPARKGLARSRSDLLKMYDQAGVFSEEALAMDAEGARQATLIDMVITAAITATGNAGTSGSDLTWNNIHEAVGTLELSGATFGPGELLCILHPQQWRDLQSQLLGTSLGDAVTHQADAPNLLLPRQIGYKGRFYGIDFVTSSRVPLANGTADRQGALIAPGGIVWAEAAIEQDPDGFMDVLGGGRLCIERERDASRALKDYYYSFYLGVSLGQNGAVVKITTDA